MPIGLRLFRSRGRRCPRGTVFDGSTGQPSQPGSRASVSASRTGYSVHLKNSARHATRPDCRRRSQQPVRPVRHPRRRRFFRRHRDHARRSPGGADALHPGCRAGRPESARRQRARPAAAPARATARRRVARDRDDRQRDGRERDRGLAARHLGLPAQAGQYSAPAQPARPDSASVRADRRSADVARYAAPTRPFRLDAGPQRCDPACVRHDRTYRADRSGRADLRRSRHRQAGRRAHAARDEPAPQRAVRHVRLPDGGQRTRRIARWTACCSVTNAARSVVPSSASRACSSRPAAARCSSTRSPSCRVAQQEALLRALDSQTFMRVGGTQSGGDRLPADRVDAQDATCGGRRRQPAWRSRACVSKRRRSHCRRCASAATILR